MAWRMQSLDIYPRANLECLIMLGRSSDSFTIFAANDRKVLELSELGRSREQRDIFGQIRGSPFSCFLQHGPSG